jgi:hypothetical protein
MSVKDSVVGVTKQVVAEIVGDGRLAEEGTRQATAGSSRSNTPEAAVFPPQQQAALAQNEPAPHRKAPLANENTLAALLGHAVLRVWADLPRDAQEQLFAAAVDDGVLATDLAELLHDRHPRTAHPAKPTRLA